MGAVDIDIFDDESERLGCDLRACNNGEYEGEPERESGEEIADSYSSWPSEKEDAGVWKEVKPVCVELTVPCSAWLNWELRECDFDERLW